jgi:hypothetical protein
MTGATFLGASTSAVCGSMCIFALAVSTLISSLFSSGAFLKQRSAHAPDRSNGLRLLRGAAQQYPLNNIPQTIFEMKKMHIDKANNLGVEFKSAPTKMSRSSPANQYYLTKFTDQIIVSGSSVAARISWSAIVNVVAGIQMPNSCKMV